MDINDDCILISERFPHIGKPLRLLWGNPEVDGYIAKLLHDDRGGSRQGFPPDVREALVRIQAQHHTLQRAPQGEAWMEQAKNRSEGYWNIDGRVR